MASIQPDSSGRSPYFYCSYRDSQGVWRLRSTKCKNRSEAEWVCNAWQREADNLRDGQKVENKEQVMEAFIALTRDIERGHFNESTAREALDAMLKATGQSAIRHVPTAEFFKNWARSKAASNAKSTATRYEQTVREFLEFLAERASIGLKGITPQDIEGFRDLQLKEGKSAVTANLAVKTLRIPFNIARKQGYILTNPAETVATLREQSGKRGVFTVEQLQALIRAADWEWRGMILLGYSAMLRMGDAARLTWGNVDLERKAIRFFPTKTGHNGKPVEVSIVPELEKFLLEWPGKSDHPKAPLFPSLCERGTGGAHGLSRRFAKLMEMANVHAAKEERTVKGKGRRFNDLSFHSLRHTGISMMANSGVAKELRMKIAGHTSEEHQRYTHLEISTLRDAQLCLPPITGDRNGK